MIAHTPTSILAQAAAWITDGARVALVTLVDFEGSTSRGRGTQMAVREDGACVGSFSGGCIEAAIVAEAQAVLAAGAGRTVRYGAGSPYLDVRLPCGGGIDLLFTPDPNLDALLAAGRLLAARRPVKLHLTEHGVATGGGYALRLAPPLRIVALGQGEDFTALMRLAASFGALAKGFSPHPRDVALLAGDGLEVTALTSLGAPLAVESDAWTALVLLFHDRDWEDALLPQVLALPAFYLGAVGSARTHAQRLARLNLPPEQTARLRGPIGLIPATRDPATLALSVLSEVVAAYPRP